MKYKRLTVTLLPVLALALHVGCSQRNTTPDAIEQSDVQHHETRVNTFVYNRQTEPTLDVDADGNVLVVWGSRRQEHGTFGVFAQRFDPLGRPLGSEMHVNQTVRGMQADPAVACEPDGSAWIAWRSDQQDGQAGNIVARRFGIDADGAFAPLTDEIPVNQTLRGHQSAPSVTVNNRGDALVAWVSDHEQRPVIMARRLDSDGNPAGDEFRVGEASVGNESCAAVVALGNGDFVATWARTDADNRPASIHARRIAAGGEAIGHEFAVNDGDDGNHIEPSIDAADDGSFVVAWMSWQGENYAVSYRRFDNKGRPAGPARVAACGPEWRSGATVAVAGDGRFAVAYNVESPTTPADATALQRPAHRTTPSEIMARRFAADGTPLGEEFRVNRVTEGRQALMIAASGRQAVWSDQDQLAVVWAGDTGADDHRGVGLSLFAPSTLTAPTPAMTPRVAAAQDVSVSDVYPLIPPVYDPLFVRGPVEPSPPSRGPDFGFLGIAATGWNPPDPDLAAGPDHVVLVVNGELHVYTHDGTSTFSQVIAGAGGFWGAQGAGSFVFDPIAVYDPHAQRFIVAAGELWNDYANSAICLAVSQTSDPGDGWHKYRWEVTSEGGFLDFPNLGVGPDAIYVANDFFNTPTGNFIWVIPKAETLVGDPVTPTPVRTSTGARSLGAVKTYDPNAPAQYFLTAYSGYSNRLAMEAITDPLGTPTLHSYSLVVPSFAQPPDAAQLGTSNLADTIDFRIKNGVYRNGSLWAVHTIGEDNTARVRWYEIVMNGWPLSGQSPVVVQGGTLDYGTGEHTWMPDIHVDDFGDALICFSRSSSSQYISVERVIRLAGDPISTLRDPVLMQESTAPETGDRWGDYSGVDEDADDPGVFWTHNEYRASSWRTWVGRVDVGVDPNDCNNNGVPDSVDISTGTSQDCNGNGVPDECDLDDGTSGDCDGNGVPDECDPDCNANAVVDACEIAAAGGLAGAYYDTIDFSGTPIGRVDGTVNFFWGTSGPMSGFDSDTFSIRWSGHVLTPAIDGTYTFFTNTDDGVRLWVDDVLIIDKWVDQGSTEWSGTIELTGDAAYAIVMEYYENGGDARAELRWQPPGDAKVIIPETSLAPALDCNENSIPDECDIAGGTSTDNDGNGIPDECETVEYALGDMNCDGAINNGDIDPFVLAITQPGQYPVDYPDCDINNADCNQDSFVNNGDIDAFLALLTGG